MATSEDWTTAEIARPEKCDFCDKDAESDAATNYYGRKGPWAYFCEDHFQTHSIGRLGLGLGQRLVIVGGE